MKFALCTALALLCLAPAAFGQAHQFERQKLVRLPSGSAVAFTAYQPTNPLQFESFDLLITADTGVPKLRFSLKNTSTKAVRFFSVQIYKKHRVQEWGAYGFSDELKIGREDGSGPSLLGSGETFDNIGKEQFELVPVDAKIMKLIDARDTNQPKIIWFCLVTKVIFEDGSLFEEKAANLVGYF